MKMPKPGDSISLKEMVQSACDLMYDLPDPQPRVHIKDTYASWTWEVFGGNITLTLDTQIEKQKILPVVYISESLATKSISDARSFATVLGTATARGLSIQNLLDLFVIVP